MDEKNKEEMSDEEMLAEIVAFVESSLLSGVDNEAVIGELVNIGMERSIAEDLIKAVEAKIEAIDTIISWMDNGMEREEIIEKLMSYEIPEEDAKYLFEEAEVIKKQIDAERELISLVISWIKEGASDEEIRENLLSLGMGEDECDERISIAKQIIDEGE